MKFFIPGIDNDKDAEKVLEATAKHISAPFPKKRTERIYTLAWTRPEGKFYAQVGAPLEAKFGGEVVMAILRADEKFGVCTASNGVLSGHPIWIYPDQIPAFVRFDG